MVSQKVGREKEKKGRDMKEEGLESERKVMG